MLYLFASLIFRCLWVNGIDDEGGYHETIQALKSLNMSQRDIVRVLSIVSGVLYLGNLLFGSKKGGEASNITNTDVLNIVADLLMLDVGLLEKSLCYRELQFGRDMTVINQKPSQASNSRHAMAKELFSRLFDHLVAIVR